MLTSHIFQVFRLVNASVIDTVFLLLTLYLCRRVYQPNYVRAFIFFSFGNFIGDWAEVFSLDIFDANNDHVHFLLVAVKVIHFSYPIFEMIFFLYVLTRLVSSDLAKNIGRVFAIIFFITYGISMYYLIAHDEWPYLMWISGGFFFKNCSLIILCLFFFVEIFRKASLPDLSRQPSFWIVNGILFYYSIESVTMFFGIYFYLHGQVQLRDTIISVGYIPAIVTFLLFIKAFSCRKER